MKRVYIFTIFLLITSSQFCFSQYHWAWARGATTTTSTPTAEGMQVAIDSLENLYVAGFFGYNISFGPYSLNGVVSCFLAKYDSSGNVQWAKGDSIGGATSNYGVCTDASGNCYVTGGFRDTVYFGSSMLIANPNNGSTYLIKYDPNGNVLWAKASIDTSWGDFAWSVATDKNANVFVTGKYTYAMSFDTCTITSTGSSNVFLAKFDSSGNTLWLRGSQANAMNDMGTAVATDFNGNVYITGFYDASYISFGTHTLFNTNPNNNDAFLVKYDPSGNVVWAQNKGAAGYDNGWGVTCDLSGNIYQVGVTDIIDTGFIIKYNPSGNILWEKQISGNPGGQIGCYEVTTDKQGNVYATGGYYATTVNISGDTIMNQPFAPSDPMYLVKYDSLGNFLFAKGVNNGGDDECGIAVGKSGSIYIGGDYIASTFVLGNDTLSYSGGGGEQVFVAKLSFDILQASFMAPSSLCTGNCIDFINNSFNASSYQWYFPGAIPDTSTAENPSNICYANTGSYDVQLIATNANGSDTLLLNNYITVYPFPPPQGITQSGDTLFAIIGSATYQWYFNSNIINGATDYFYVAQASGDYNVICTENGCEVEAVIFNVIANTQFSTNDLTFAVYPNPVEEKLFVKSLSAGQAGYPLSGIATEISIYNILGEKLLFLDYNQNLAIDCKSLKPGIYFIEINSGEKIFRSKFIKK